MKVPYFCGGRERVAAGHRADLHHPPDPQHVPAGIQTGLDALKRDVKPIYTAVNADAAPAALDQLTETWGGRYGAIVRLWENAWEQFIPFLDYDIEIRTVLCSTNTIESLNARYRRAIKARGHFPTEQAALKCLYLVTRSLDPTGTGRTRWTIRWKPALNAFAVTFADRFPAAETY
jgi:transposase-like protein